MQPVLEAEPVREGGDLPALVFADEGHRDSGATGAAGASDAVDVGLVIGGCVEVDDVRDARHVDPAGGHIGGDEHVDLSGLEAAQCRLTLALGLVAVHRDRVDPLRGRGA